MKKVISITNYFVICMFYLVILAGCELTAEEKEKLNDAQVDLELLADQIIITFPANESVIKDPVTIVRADIPSTAEAKEVRLYVDGIEVAKDTDGSPWEISWPTYYWADGKPHTLLLKTITGAGNEVRNNQQFQVIVDIQANSSLKFAEGLDGLVVSDVNVLYVEFDRVPEATSYEIFYSDGGSEVLETSTNNLEISGLGVGIYDFKYRAIWQYSDQTSLIGPWSNSVSVEISPPSLPTINPSSITKSDNGYDLELTWENSGEVDSYTIYLNNLLDDSQEIYEVGSGSGVLISGLGIGRYEWQLKRTNFLGQDSLLSNIETIDVGMFSKRLGGSKDDRSKQIVASSDGGYVVLGYTKSHEVYEEVDSSGDDWIIKLDSQGNVEWEYISSAIGRDRFRDIVELSDGSVVAVGSDWDTQKAVALRLDKNGSRLWEIVYRPSSISERYHFSNVVEFNNSLYVSSSEWGVVGCSACTEVVHSYLHTISIETGEVSDLIDIPGLPGLDIDTVTELGRTSTGELLLAGYAMPEGVDPDAFIQGGGFIQVLDSNLSQSMTWDNVGASLHLNVNHVIELSNGNFSVIGQGWMGEAAISLVSSSGKELRQYLGDYTQEFYGGEPIASGNDGQTYAVFLSKSYGGPTTPYALTFMYFNSILNLESRLPLLGFKDNISVSGMLHNGDGSFTLLLSEGQNGNKNYDIVLVKMLLN